MNLCHLYTTTTTSAHANYLLEAFDDSISIDIEIVHTFDDYAIYVLEIGKVTKEISLKLKKIFESKINPLIYFLIPKEHSLALFQLAFLLQAKRIITLHQDIYKVINNIRIDFITHVDAYNGSMLGKNLMNNYVYMIFNGNQLAFASRQLLQDFNCNTLLDVEDKVCSKLDLYELLAPDECSIKKMVIKNLQENETYFVKSVTNSNETLISFEAHKEYESSCGELSYVSNRISFVELLKDKLIEKIIATKAFSLITIHIKNLKNIGKSTDKAELASFLKEFLLEVELILGQKSMLAQYDSDLYIACFENIHFHTIQEKAKNFHLQISKFITKQNFKPILSLHALDTDTLELNSILEILDSIASNSLTKEQTETDNLVCVNNFQESMSDKEIISFLLDSAFVNNTEFKLLNFYKGMCINTVSAILKKTDNEIYVKVEQIQGSVMSIDKKTVLQSTTFTRDIQASVKYIDVREKIAILHNFKILESNANLRKHGRVDFHIRTTVAISLVGSKISGEILDISANSIAIRVKHAKILNNILNKDIGLTFYLPNKISAAGDIKLEETANVIYESCGIDGYLKLVCTLYENSINENIILEYVYERQKNIIKRMREMIA